MMAENETPVRVDAMIVNDTLVKRLRNAGYKITPPRLAVLEVREARHDERPVPPRGVDDGALEPPDARDSVAYGVDQEKPRVERDLVVSTAGGVELVGRRAYELLQPGLDRHVDILVRGTGTERTALDLLLHLLQACADPLRLRLRHEPLLREHRDVRETAPDIVPEEDTVEADGGGERLHLARHLPVEPAGPKLPGHGSPPLPPARSLLPLHPLRPFLNIASIRRRRPFRRMKPVASAWLYTAPLASKVACAGL